MNSSLHQLNEVLYGNGLLTTELFSTGKDLLIGLLPGKWLQIWEGPESPSNWLKGFYKRISALKTWVEKTRNGSLCDQPINLAELFHPEVFLNAFRQKVSRKLKLPLNELKLIASLDQSKISSNLVVKLKGLQLQGCSVEGAMLTDGPADLPEFTQLSDLCLTYVP